MSREIRSKRQKTTNEEEHSEFLQLSLSLGSTDHQPPPEPPSIFQLKDEHVEPEHEELVRLTLSTGSTYQSPAQKPPLPPPPPLESPPHPPLLQLMPPSSSAPSQTLEPPPPPKSQPHQSFLQLLSLFHPSLISSPQYQEPPPGFSFPMPSSSSRQTQPPPEQTQSSEGQAHRSGVRRVRNYRKPGWKPIIEPPYPWASSFRAKVLSMEELLSLNITVISGYVYCKECKKEFQIEHDLRSKFSEVVSFIAGSVELMHDRAPSVWLKPQDIDCKFCGKSKCVQPVTSTKKRKTNWLFLFLGQMIGYCNLTHLKYFCKHNTHHRTAAKDRLVYLTYMTLHCQLDPKASGLYKEE